MSRPYHHLTQPSQRIQQKSREQFNLRYLLRMRKPISLRLKFQHNEKLMEQQNYSRMYEEYGSPQSVFLKDKIKNLASPRSFAPKNRKRGKLDTESTILSTLDQSKISYGSRRMYTDPSEKEEMQQKAMFKNQQQKLQRLLLKCQQKQQRFQQIARLIKVRSAPKKAKVVFKGPPHMQDKTWYTSWLKANQKQTQRKQQLIKQKRNRRCHTQILPAIF